MIPMNNVETTDKAATTAEQGSHVAPETASSKKGAPQKKRAPNAKKAAKGAKAKTAGTKKEAKVPRAAQKDTPEARVNKKAEVIAMMKRAKGVTLAEIMEATGWQKHTVRGFVSVLGSKGGLKIESAKNDAGERSYLIERPMWSVDS
jgi:hypothetical protein